MISESFLRENYSDRNADEVFKDYQAATGGLVIFTFGERPGWFARPGQQAQTFEPYPTETVDTTGAGDSFRAGIVYGFLKGWNDDKMMDFAAATAAIVCNTFPGVLHSPSLDEVLGFVDSAGRNNP